MTVARTNAIVRAVAVVLLFATTLCVMLLSRERQMKAIKTENPEMQYVYSDEGLSPVGMPEDSGTDVFVKLGLYDKKYDIDAGFVDFCAEDERINADGNFLTSLKSRLDAGDYDDDIWAELTGYTFSVLYDLYTGAPTEIIGDPFDQNKTVISVFDGVAAGELTEMLANATLGFDAPALTELYISGGLKFAFCGDADGITEAKSISDIVIARVDAADANAAADAGADVILVAADEPRIEYAGDAVVLYGTDGMYVSVTLAVGIAPIVRVYPIAETDGSTELMNADSAKAVYDAINSRSESARLDENGRVRYK